MAEEILRRRGRRSVGAGRPPDASWVELLDGLSAADRVALRRFYFGAMQAMAGTSLAGKCLVDKNPALNLMIPLMRHVFPALKLIVIIRDPRDVAVSCFLRYPPLNPVSVCFLTLQRTAERYALDMSAWLEFRDVIIPPWVEVRYEDAVADLRVTVERMSAAIGLPWHESVLDYRKQHRTAWSVHPLMSTWRRRFSHVRPGDGVTTASSWNRCSRFSPPLVKSLGYAD